MKIISTICFVHGEKEALLGAKGIFNGHHQYRIYCKARGVKHANELCQDIGYRVFVPDFTGSCGQAMQDFFTAHPEITYVITDAFHNVAANQYITNLDIERLKRHE